MRTFFTALLLCMSLGCLGQSIQLKGIIKNEDKQAIEFANIVLQTRDSNMVTGASSDAKGHFELMNINAGTYRLVISSVGCLLYTSPSPRDRG